MNVTDTSLKNCTMSSSRLLNANLLGGMNLLGSHIFNGSPVNTMSLITSATVSSCMNVIKSALPVKMLELEPSSSSSNLYTMFSNEFPIAEAMLSGVASVGAGSNTVPNPPMSMTTLCVCAKIVSIGSFAAKPAATDGASPEDKRSNVTLTLSFRSPPFVRAALSRSSALNAPSPVLCANTSLSNPVSRLVASSATEACASHTS